MTDILDEVLNDTKDEKRILLFRKFLPKIIIIALIGAACITFYNWSKNKTIEHNQRLGDILVDVVSGEVTDKNLSSNSLQHLISNNENRQAELADIFLASQMRQNGDNQAALNRLSSIIDNHKYEDITRTYARILYLSIILDQESISEDDNIKAKKYMDYFNDEKQLFYVNATLLKSLFYKKIGQIELADQYANNILNIKDISPIVKEQATAILANIKNNI